MTHPYSRYRSLPFDLDPHASQYIRERRERALALYLQQQPGNQPIPNAPHAQEYEEDFDIGFPFYGYRARQQTGIQRAQRNFAAFQAHLEEQHLFADRHLDAENLLAEPVDLVSAQDELSLRDMIDAHLMEEHNLMEEHRSQVRDMLQLILARLNERTPTKTPTERDLVTSPAALTASSTPVNVNWEGTTPLQEGEAPSAAQVASSLSKITSITARLETLLANFQFPAELHFSPALGTADVFALTYTSGNAPLHSQELALSLLLADLDNIPSFGLDAVRNARRAAVARVDQALQELQIGVKERRGRAHAMKTGPVTVPVE
ncbi:hypothetical protein EDB19DRAFT_1680486 [Suillus lakei]|nr:hypothetical protein EDB19DRAFT_1680486 [Suillus lakei]